MMDVAYNAVIRQNSGEDWNNVDILLSTAKPHLKSEQPQLKKWSLSILDRSQALKKIQGLKKKVDLLSAVNTFTIVTDRESANRTYLPKTIQQSAAVEGHSASIGVVLKKKNTVRSDNILHKVSIMKCELPVHFRYSTVPKLMPRAFLKAKVKNKSDFPFLPGKANVFLDNNFISETKINHASPQEIFWVFLGVEEGIKVEYSFIRKSVENKGSKGKYIISYESLIKVKNNKKEEEEVIIWDQLPIANQKNITIKLLEPKIAKKTTNPKIDPFKLISWFYILQPGQELEIPFKFSVTYPNYMYLDDGFGY
jgi:uncharacterized protein (TIGR02231 family)